MCHNSTLRELGLNMQNGVARGDAEVEPALVVAGNTAFFNPDIEKNGPIYRGESALVQNERMHDWGKRGAGQDGVGRRGASVQGWGSIDTNGFRKFLLVLPCIWQKMLQKGL
jgi:hypothetical protein